MNSYLKQSTASQARAIGPFVDDTDFKTAETGLTIANTDIKLVVNGGASANKNSGGGTHRVNGIYGITFDATDTATVGEIELSVVVAGALPVFHKFFVLEEAVYDAMFGASAPGYLQPTVAGRTVDVAAGGEVGLDYANVSLPDGAIPALGIAEGGTAQGATATTLQGRASDAYSADAVPAGAMLGALGSTQGYWQFRPITSYTSATKTYTVPTWPVTPTGTITYRVFGGAPMPAETGAAIADAVWDEATAGHATAGTTGKALTDAGSAGDPWSTAVPGAYGAGTAGKALSDTLAAVDTETGTIVTQTSAASMRTALGLATANLDTQLGDVPTNAELATALGTSDDAILTAIAALNNLSAAGVRTAIGLATGNLDTQLADLPTNAELTAALNTLLTTAMTESYAADGATMTPAQAFYMLVGLLSEFSIAGTTLTVKKRDGTTTAATFTLDDDATPTAISRSS